MAQDLDVLQQACEQIFGRSFCALGDGATSPVFSGLQYFRDEFEHLVEHGRLPDGVTLAHAGAVTDNSGRHRPTLFGAA